MREHPFVAIAKVGLLAFVAVMLTLDFVAHNDTQRRVIETRRTVDDLRQDVAEVRRSLAQGAAARPAAGTPAGPATPASTGPRTPGWIPLLEAEEDAPRPPDDQIDWRAQLRLPLPVEPKGMNIYTSDRDAYTAVDIGHYVYGPLAERRRANKDTWKPGLAEWAEVSPDHTEFRVWVRPGVRWHRPAVDLASPRHAWMRGEREVTAEDLAFTLAMIMDKRADTDGVRSSYDNPDSGVAEWKAESKHVFWIRWKKPNFFATSAVLSDLMPLPKWIYAAEEDGTPIDEASLGQKFATHWFNKQMCGYGPYAFKEYKTSDYVLLERNEGWWGRRPAFQTVLYRLAVSADELRYNLFLRTDDAGNRDLHVYAFSPVRWKREVLEGKDDSPFLDPRRALIYAYQRMAYAYTAWACRSKWFSDKRVRQAMTLAANREAWRVDILNEIAIFPTGPAFPLSPEYDRTIAPWPYDLERAKALLEEAGWRDEDGNGVREKTIDGEKVEFRVKMLETSGSSPEIDATLADWQQSLRKIGVMLETNPVEWNEFLKRLRDREFDCVSGGWQLGDEFQPDGLFHSRFIPIAGSQNYPEWSHPRADELMDALLTEFDLPRRYTIAHEFHRIFHEEQPYTMLWAWVNPRAIDARLGGYVARAFTPQVDLRDMWWQKDGPARYEDGRDKGKGWRRKAGS